MSSQRLAPSLMTQQLLFYLWHSAHGSSASHRDQHHESSCSQVELHSSSAQPWPKAVACLQRRAAHSQNLLHACRDVLLIAIGTRPALDPLGPYTVDYQGTVNLITAAKAAGVKKVGLGM